MAKQQEAKIIANSSEKEARIGEAGQRISVLQKAGRFRYGNR